MRVEIHYFAFDETEFDTEEACLEYESQMLHLLDSVIFFDSNRNKMITPHPDAIETRAYYMFIVDKIACVQLFDWLETQCIFTKPTCIYAPNEVLQWNDAKNRWENLTVEMKVLNTQYDSIISKAMAK